MPVRGHDERSAVRMPELDRDVSVRDAEFKEVGGTEVPQLVEVHRGPSEPRPNRSPVVQVAGLRELSSAGRDKQPRHVNPCRYRGERISCRWREDDGTHAAVLRGLDLSCRVKALPDRDLVLAHVSAL